MSFLGNLFGKKSVVAKLSESEMISRTIEVTEGELHDAEDRLLAATDNKIKESLEFLVSRKTQAIADLKDKLRAAQVRENT